MSFQVFNNPKINRALQIFMLPFLMGKFTCQIIFVDRVRFSYGIFCAFSALKLYILLV